MGIVSPVIVSQLQHNETEAACCATCDCFPPHNTDIISPLLLLLHFPSCTSLYSALQSPNINEYCGVRSQSGARSHQRLSDCVSWSCWWRERDRECQTTLGCRVSPSPGVAGGREGDSHPPHCFPSVQGEPELSQCALVSSSPQQVLSQSAL